MNLKLQSKKYFSFFANKDLEGLTNIFDQNVTIKDWMIEKKKLKNVIELNKKIFKKFKEIEIEIKEIFVSTKLKSTACKIKIKLDKTTIDVIDLIYFNKKEKIIRIEAYKL
jgi:hypothetical protein